MREGEGNSFLCTKIWMDPSLPVITVGQGIKFISAVFLNTVHTKNMLALFPFIYSALHVLAEWILNSFVACVKYCDISILINKILQFRIFETHKSNFDADVKFVSPIKSRKKIVWFPHFLHGDFCLKQMWSKVRNKIMNWMFFCNVITNRFLRLDPYVGIIAIVKSRLFWRENSFDGIVELCLNLQIGQFVC